MRNCLFNCYNRNRLITRENQKGKGLTVKITGQTSNFRVVYKISNILFNQSANSSVNQAVPQTKMRYYLTLSAQSAKPWAFADGIDQDQTAQNVKSDLGSMQSACSIKRV